MAHPEERKADFRSVELGMTHLESVMEAARCLRCYRIGMVALG